MVAVKNLLEQPPRVRLWHGQAHLLLARLPTASVHAIVTDPPAGIEFMGSEWDTFRRGRLENYEAPPGGTLKDAAPQGAALRGRMNAHPSYAQRANRRCVRCGMYQWSSTPCACADPQWAVDTSTRDTFVAAMTLVFVEAYRVLKPGGHALVWAIPRTSHWTALALEDAGFDIRDVLTHHFGSGFPKSLDVGKAIDGLLTHGSSNKKDFHDLDGARRAGGTGLPAQAERHGFRDVAYEHHGAFDLEPQTAEGAAWDGWGSALKPGTEHWILCRKPLAQPNIARQVLDTGTGALNVDGCRVAYAGTADEDGATPQGRCTSKESAAIGAEPDAGRHLERIAFDRPDTAGRWPANLLLSHSAACDFRGVVLTESAPWPRTRPPGGISTNGHRGQETVPPRPEQECAPVWDCAPDCPVAAMNAQSGASASTMHPRGDSRASTFNASPAPSASSTGYADTGGAARYFNTFAYAAKPSRAERDAGCEDLPGANNHPTVKGIELMRWLVRLITPPGGTVLDPFMGSGTTGIAALCEGRDFVGMERKDSYIERARARLAYHMGALYGPLYAGMVPIEHDPHPEEYTA
jgi:DNA modification methylase